MPGKVTLLALRAMEAEKPRWANRKRARPTSRYLNTCNYLRATNHGKQALMCSATAVGRVWGWGWGGVGGGEGLDLDAHCAWTWRACVCGLLICPV